MKKIFGLVLFIFVLFSSKTNAQVALTYYPFQSILSVSTNTDKLIWGDLRIESNTFFSNINTEFDAMINLKRTDWVNYYAGLGININPSAGIDNLPLANGYVLTTGVRIKPIQSIKNFQVVFELAPYINRHLDGGILRTLLGVGYNF